MRTSTDGYRIRSKEICDANHGSLMLEDQLVEASGRDAHDTDMLNSQPHSAAIRKSRISGLVRLQTA